MTRFHALLMAGAAALLLSACGAAPTKDAPADTVNASLKIDKEISDDGAADEPRGPAGKAVGANGENSIYFKLGATEIDAEGLAKLARWAAKLKENPKSRILLIGHTDNLGSRAYNVAISDQRVTNVMKVLKAQGVPLAHIHKYGLGGEKANLRCRTGPCLDNLRRVEIVFTEPARKK